MPEKEANCKIIIRSVLQLIKIENIKKEYKIGDVVVNAIRGVSFQVKPKEFVSIMGPSGSGKSTCLHILGCLDRPSSGSYRLDGLEVSQLSDAELARVRSKKIGFVFQSFNLLPKANALQNVELPLIYAGVTNRKSLCIEALVKVGLSARMKHKPLELSGGEQQRVAIARAIVNDPSIILADEPTGNLDSVSGREIMSVFCDLHKQGITVLLITHDRSVAEYGDRIIHFKDGAILEEEILSKEIGREDRINAKP